MGKTIYLTKGEKFNRLIVIKLHHINTFKNKYNRITNREYYLCKCDCGNYDIVRKDSLKNNNVKSCGCLQKEKVKKHGLRYTRIYKILDCMKERCYNKNKDNYYLYGARGITVCKEWLEKDNGIINFYTWAINNGYKENLTIDRIDNNGNYEPSNCRWATMKEQGRNKRNNYLITYKGETHCLSEWAETFNINRTTISSRLKNGWDITRTFKKTT